MTREPSQLAMDSTPTLVGLVLRSTGLVFLSCLTVFGYHFFFQATKPSPVSDGSWTGLVLAIAFCLAGSAAVTVVCVPLAIAADLLPRARLGRWPGHGLGTISVCAGLYWIGFLAVVENFLYAVAGVGLKDAEQLIVRLIIGGISLLAAAVVVRTVLLRISARMVQATAISLFVTVLPAVGVVSYDAVTTNHPSKLKASGNPDLVNVIIVSSDGIDAERLASYGYERNTTPFLSSKASEFALFENAFTNNGNTTGSITSMLTGRSPLATGVVYPPDMLGKSDALLSLPYLLKEWGYYRSNWAVPHYADAEDQNLVDAFDVNNGSRSRESLLATLPLGASTGRWFFLETVESSASLVLDVLGVRAMDNPVGYVAEAGGGSMGDDERLDAVTHEIRTHSRFFINTHFMVTHGPRFKVHEPFFSKGVQQRGDYSRDFYDDAIRQFDQYVERIYAELSRTGKLDKTLLIVTSDHGIGWDPLKRVPLLIRFPDARPVGHVALNVQRLDIAPTILDVLGLEQPRWMEGRSLARLEQIPADRQFMAANVSEALRTADGTYLKMNDDGLIVTAVRCRSFLKQHPDGDVERGQISGSTSVCRDEPQEFSAFNALIASN